MGLRKARILVVDDKRANLLALEMVLGGEYEVRFAASGAEALAAVQAQRDIDLILMDVQMPEMDGFEAAARIKQLEGGREIPIIFVTAIYTEDPFHPQRLRSGGHRLLQQALRPTS